jgi:GGDEF domain-containing protein
MHSSHSSTTFLPTDLTAAHIVITALRAELAERDFDPAYGLPTRFVLERRVACSDVAGMALIYVDLDDLNRLNAIHSETEMDARIRAVFSLLHSQLRHTDLFCRYRSGDEMIALVPLRDADGVAARLQDALRQHGMSGSIVVQPLTDSGLQASVKAAYAVLAATRRGALGIGWRGWGWRAFVVTADGTRQGGAYRCPWWARPLVWGQRVMREGL